MLVARSTGLFLCPLKRHSSFRVYMYRKLQTAGTASTKLFDLTIITLSSSDIAEDILTCVRKNRLLVALAQGHQYCHFYPMDPSRAITWYVYEGVFT